MKLSIVLFDKTYHRYYKQFNLTCPVYSLINRPFVNSSLLFVDQDLAGDVVENLKVFFRAMYKKVATFVDFSSLLCH